MYNVLWSQINQNTGLNRCGVVDKPPPCKPGFAGSIPSFTSLSDGTLSCGPVSICLYLLPRRLAQTNRQKKTKNPLNFSMMSHGITSTEMGPESMLINWKPQNGFQGSEKRNTSLSYHMTPHKSNIDNK